MAIGLGLRVSYQVRVLAMGLAVGVLYQARILARFLKVVVVLAQWRVPGAVVTELEGGDATVQREVVLAAAYGQLTRVIHLRQFIQAGLGRGGG